MSESEAKQSDENPEKTEDDGFNFDYEEVLETINDYIKELQGRFESEGARERFEQGKYQGPIVLASDPEVVQEAIENMVNIRQQKKAVELGYEKDEKINRIEVNMDIPENTVEFVKEFDNILAEVRQPIVEEIENREEGADKNPMLEDKDPIMTYIFEKTAGAYGDVTILGGAKALIFNLAEQHGFTEDERELLRKCHEVAADKNGVERHTLVEDVVFAPQFKHEDVRQP